MASEVKSTEKSEADRDTIFIGKKPPMSYVLAVITQFSEGTNPVHVKARGRSISTAVDVAELIKNKFLKDVKASVGIATEVIEAERGKMNVSTIDITLTK